MVHIYTKQYSSAIRKGWNLGTCNNMDGPRGYYAKWSKSDRGRQYTMISLTWNLKNKWTQTKKKQTQGYREQTGVGRWEDGVKRWTK